MMLAKHKSSRVSLNSELNKDNTHQKEFENIKESELTNHFVTIQKQSRNKINSLDLINHSEIEEKLHKLNNTQNLSYFVKKDNFTSINANNEINKDIGHKNNVDNVKLLNNENKILGLEIGQTGKFVVDHNENSSKDQKVKKKKKRKKSKKSKKKIEKSEIESFSADSQDIQIQKKKSKKSILNKFFRCQKEKKKIFKFF
jgi:hypothetical protein